MQKRLAGTVALASLVVLFSCTDSGTEVATPVGITVVSGDGQAGTVGEALSQPITVRVVDGSDNPVSGVAVGFQSESGSFSPATATTDGDGEASAVWTLGTTAGAQTATAAADNLSAGISATAAPGPLAALAVTPSPATFTALGDTIQLSAGATDEFGNGIASPGVTWSSSDGSVAQVGATGLVTAQGNGTADIVATADGVADTVAVTVAQEAAGASITAPTDRVAWSGTLQLTGGVVDANGFPVSGGVPAWSSADSTIASVDTAGLVTGTGLGTVDITVTQDSESATLAVTVTPVPGATLSKRLNGGCLLDETGAAYCWGYGGYGQNGDGTLASSNVPVAVAGGHRFVALGTALNRHHCALTEDGEAYCWGQNSDNQLGDGTGTNSAVPVAVQGGLTFRSIGAGYSHSCGLTTDGDVYCWGNNAAGQLGDGTTTNQPAPVAVMMDSTVNALSVGGHTSCALVGTTAYCWGLNSVGETGDGTTASPRTTPVAVAGGHAFSRISTGGTHGCGLDTGGVVYCWGHNDYGQLGDGTTTASSVPVAVDGLRALDDIVAGYWTTCAIDGGTGYCWGDNGRGVLGDGTTTQRETPAMMAGGLSWAYLVPGQITSCGVTTDGVPYCWGETEWLGDGSTLQELEPVAVAGGHTFSSIRAGYDHTCGSTAAPAVYCWGNNDHGQLGLGDDAFRTTPAQLTGGSLAWADAGWSYTCGLSDSGDALCWGDNPFGQLGVGDQTEYDTPQSVDAAFALTAIDAGRVHSCGIRGSDGTAYCWGANDQGQVGDASNTDRASPVGVAGGLTFTTIAVGDFHSCGLTPAGDAYCWGDNFYGQLGDAGNTDSSAPVAVAGGLTFQGITAGGIHTCAWTAAGDAYCWGDNSYGQLGDGGSSVSNVPVAVSGGVDFVQISAGTYHTCGVSAAGDSYCWGRNSTGQLGDGSTFYRNVPTPVAGSLTVASITTGYEHSCALGTDGVGYCWGPVGFGMLGNGAAEYTLLPTPVAGALVVPVG